jgi:hypothetical protein
LTNQIDELAQRQLKDYRSKKLGKCFSEQGFGLNISKAYAVQDEVVSCEFKRGKV